MNILFTIDEPFNQLFTVAQFSKGVHLLIRVQDFTMDYLFPLAPLSGKIIYKFYTEGIVKLSNFSILTVYNFDGASKFEL